MTPPPSFFIDKWKLKTPKIVKKNFKTFLNIWLGGPFSQNPPKISRLNQEVPGLTRKHNSIKWSCAWQLHAHVLVRASWACSWTFHEHRCSWKPHKHNHESFTSTLNTICKGLYVFIFSIFLIKVLGLDLIKTIFWILILRLRL